MAIPPKTKPMMTDHLSRSDPMPSESTQNNTMQLLIDCFCSVEYNIFTIVAPQLNYNIIKETP